MLHNSIQHEVSQLSTLYQSDEYFAHAETEVQRERVDAFFQENDNNKMQQL